jgi:predicted PurR-regulated permease PerM
MTHSSATVDEKVFVRRAVEAAIRIFLVAALAVWCLRIFSPFVMPVLWAVIFSVALFPFFERSKAWLGGRTKLAAVLLTLLALAVLIVPTVMLSVSLVDSVQNVTRELEAGTLTVPPPGENVAGWPLIGEQLDAAWREASKDIGTFIEKYSSHLEPAWRWLVAQAAGAGATVLQFVLAILIMGIFLATAEVTVSGAKAVATRLAGEDGEAMVVTMGATVRSVVQGVLGVALIQAILAGLGMLVVGVPAAGLWALLVLILAVIQLPPILILGPVMVYVFSTADTLPAVFFLIWSILVSASDAILKPLLLGRGVAVPMPVILIGALGGMVMSGIVGLFVGAVVLALGYQLAVAWVKRDAPENAAGGEPAEVTGSA